MPWVRRRSEAEGVLKRLMSSFGESVDISAVLLPDILVSCNYIYGSYIFGFLGVVFSNLFNENTRLR